MIGGRVIRRAGAMALEHPGWVMGGAALAGIASQHPVKPISEGFQEEMLGDKNAIQNVARATAISGIENAFRTPSQARTIDRFTDYPQAHYQGEAVSPSVNGALIFGLYNRRLGG